jgi:predicted DNA binding CopG/RHH family protein
MKSRIKYTNEDLGSLRVIDDFLPPPEQLAFKVQDVKVTIMLSKSSLEFFKKQAEKYNTAYQRLIRGLLDTYAEHHGKSTAGSTRP